MIKQQRKIKFINDCDAIVDTSEKVVEYLISKEYVITNYFDMTETEG